MPDYYEKIKELEKELSETKYNKRTQHHIGLIKAKIAQLREKIEQRGKSSSGGQGYAVRKSGDGTAVLVGYPSTGKSTLLNALTNANSEVGEYAFTTLDVIPGLLEYKFAKIQILDVPGIIDGAALGRGRGKEVLSVVRNSDLVILVVDATQLNQVDSLKRELFYAGIRINKHKPDVIIKRTMSNGIKILKTVKLTKLSDSTIKAILNQFRIMNADVLIREDISDDDLIDVIEGNKRYLPAITVVNKIDLVDEETIEKIKKEIKPDIMISAKNKFHIEELKQLIYEKFGFINIFMKEPNKEPDLDEPLIMRQGCTIEDVCNKIHRDFVKNFKYARVWGKSVKFPGQIKGLKHELLDGDIVELHILN